MKISTIGTGNMARSLGGAWAALGHQVFFGSRDSMRGQEAAELIGLGTQGGDHVEALWFSDTILYTPRSVPTDVIGDRELLSDKVLIDCGNRPVPPDLAFGPPEIPSYAERIAVDVSKAKVVKAFNTMAQEIFDHSVEERRESGQVVFLAGDSEDAKATVSMLTLELGLEPLDCGPLSNAWMLESAADLIRYLIVSGRGPHATFGVPTLSQTPPKYGGRRVSEYR